MCEWWELSKHLSTNDKTAENSTSTQPARCPRTETLPSPSSLNSISSQFPNMHRRQHPPIPFPMHLRSSIQITHWSLYTSQHIHPRNSGSLTASRHLIHQSSSTTSSSTSMVTQSSAGVAGKTTTTGARLCSASSSQVVLLVSLRALHYSEEFSAFAQTLLVPTILVWTT